MRNFSKTLISMAAVMAVGSAMAAGAMAADMAATYDPETGVVTITDAVSNGASNTLLIVKGEANTAATEETIKQIDQVDEDKAFTSAVLGTGLVAGDTYELRVGGTNGTMQTVVFAIPSNEEDVDPVIIYAGDVDGSDEVDSSDAMYIFEYEANWWEQQPDDSAEGYTAFTADEKTLYEEVEWLDGTTYYLGDVDGSGEVDSSDAMYIFEYEANWWEAQPDDSAEGYTAFTAGELKVLPAE